MDFYAWLKTQWDRVGAALLAVAGVVALCLGYNGVSHSTLPTQQIPYLASGGLLAVLFLGGAATLWLSADLRDEWRKLDEIHRELRAQRAGGTEADGATGASGPGLFSGEPTRPVGIVAGPAVAGPAVAGPAVAGPAPEPVGGVAGPAPEPVGVVAGPAPEPVGVVAGPEPVGPAAPAPRRATGTRTTRTARRPSTSK